MPPPTQKRKKEIDEFLNAPGIGGLVLSGETERPRLRPEDEPKNEWERLARMESGSPSKFEEKNDRIPKLHDFYLTLAHDAE